MSPLVSTSELAALQADFARGYTTLATIKRPVIGSDVLGDDAADTDPATVGTVYGWLASGPVPEAVMDGGVVTVNTVRFDCPVGTDIRPRDWLAIGARTYIVSDTTSDETLPITLSVTMRIRE